MKLIVPESLMVPLKIMLAKLQIKYCQFAGENIIYLLDEQDDTVEIALPFDKRAFYALVKQLSSLNYLDYQISFVEAAAYVYQLDRWKTRYDGLAAQVKTSGEINFLNRHLFKQIVFARGDYQRNEAVGLNLAKTEILEKQLSGMSEPVLALAGDVEILSRLDFWEAFGRLSGSKCNFYTTFSYRQLFSSMVSWGEYLKELLPNAHRFRHQGKVFWENNSHCYDGMLFIAKDEETVFIGKERLSRCDKIEYCLLKNEDDFAAIVQATDLLLEKII